MYVVSSKGPMRPYSLLKKNKNKNKKKEREGASLDNKQTPFFYWVTYKYMQTRFWEPSLPSFSLNMGR